MIPLDKRGAENLGDVTGLAEIKGHGNAKLIDLAHFAFRSRHNGCRSDETLPIRGTRLQLYRHTAVIWRR
uniref:hypothetical protein n=1 Tax=Rhizobium rhizogenes TaxID=359 RepID=UPI00155DCC30|nr:hypothetical protein [Rhizobium rhizogenes]